MKNNIINTILAGVFGLVFVTSCNIEPTYYSQVAPDTYFDSKEAVWQRFYRPFTHARWAFAQDASYFNFQELGTDAFCSPVRGSQNAGRGEEYKMHYHNIPVTSGISYQCYVSRMAGVSRCWATLDDLSEVDLGKFGFPAGTRENWTAQMKAMAAAYYLEALDLFGGMPLYEESAEDVRGRSTDVETFRLIERLLNESISGLEKKTDLGGYERGDIRQAAAAVWLMRLYFNAEAYIREARYEEAARIAQELLDGKYGTYDLDGDWTVTFGFNNEYSKEIIWSIPSASAQLETDTRYMWSEQMPANMKDYLGGIENSGSNNKTCLTPGLDANGNEYVTKLGRPFAKFHNQDIRKQPYCYLGNETYKGMFVFGELKNPGNSGWTVKGTQEYRNQTLNLVDQIARLSENGTESSMETGEENSGIRLVKFSPRPNANEARFLFNPDIPLIRYAEVYYTLAECKMRSGDKKGAANLINKVRKRYFADETDPDPVTAENLDKYRMLDEWLIEFLGECRRRTDLIRWNEYVEGTWWDHTADGARNAHLKRFPIATSILDSNPLLEQNPGYEE